MNRKVILALTVALGSVIAASAADGKALWDKECAKCHGADGKGDTKMGKKLKIKDLTDAKVQGEFTDEAACKAIKEGLKDQGGKVQMKPVKDLLDDDIKALVAYLRQFKK